MKTSRHLAYKINMHLVNAFDFRNNQNASFVIAKLVGEADPVFDIQLKIHMELREIEIEKQIKKFYEQTRKK